MQNTDFEETVELANIFIDNYDKIKKSYKDKQEFEMLKDSIFYDLSKYPGKGSFNFKLKNMLNNI